MKRKHTITLAAASTIGLLTIAGCSDEPSQLGTGGVTADDVRQDASEAADTTTDFVQGQMETYAESMQHGIDALNNDIDHLESRAEEMTGDARSRAEEAIDNLRVRRDAFVERLRETRSDSSTAWDDIKSGLDEAWNSLDEARKDALERFGG